MAAREIRFIAGFGLFHGWVIALLTYAGTGPLGAMGPFASVALVLVGGIASACVFLAMGQHRESVLAAMTDGLLVFATCAVLTAFSTEHVAAALASCAVCGLLCGSLHCMYGLASLSFAKQEFARIIALATVVASLVAMAAVLVAAHLPLFCQALVLIALPLAAALILKETQATAKGAAKRLTTDPDVASEKVLPRFVRLLAAVLLFGAVCRTCDVFSTMRFTGATISSLSLFASHIAAAGLLLAMLYGFRRGGSMAQFYRLALPCAGAGFVVLALPGEGAMPFSVAAVLLTGAGFEVINLVAWVLTSYAAQVSARPVRYFAMYALVTYVAMLVGRLVNMLVLPYAAHHAAFMGLVCIVVLVMVALVILPEDQVCLFEESLRVSQEEKAEGTAHRERCVAFAEAYGLTERETEVLELLARGRTLKVVAERLTISKGTAGTHIANIYRKTEVHKQQDLIDLFEKFGA